MKEKINWCVYFKNIEKDPTAIVPSITVGQFLEARDHIQNCNSCFNSTGRTLAKAPKDDTIGFKGSKN